MKPAIITKYLPSKITGLHPPGRRIVATGGGARIVMQLGNVPPSMYELMHRRAAGAVRTKLGLRGALIAGPIKGGFAFVFANQRSVA